MNGLDLFAGSGIGSLAFRHTIPGYRTVCYVENDPYCQAVLVARIKDGLLEDAPIWDDVRTFDGTKWRGKVDIVSGGFPCQPFSVAGQRKGETDERNLWPDTARIIGEIRPRYAFLENVPGLISSGYFETILCDLAKIGYDCEWDVVSAAFVGAPHLRKRLWVLAWDTDSGDGKERSVSRVAERQKTESARSCNDVADPNGARELQSEGSQQDERGRLGNCGWWNKDPIEGSAQSSMGRVAHGIPFRVDRLKMLGNAWVPQVVVQILKIRTL